MKDKLHRIAVEKARAPWGLGWSSLTEDHREALVARQVLLLLLAQCESLGVYEPAKDLVRKAMRWGPES